MKNLRLFFLLLTGLFITAPYAESINADESKPEKKTVAVLDMEAKGIDESGVTALSDRFRSELFNTGAFVVMERGRMTDILKEQGFQSSGACTDNECLVEIGQLLGVEGMIAGSIGKLGKLFLINVRIINIQTGEIERTESIDCNCPIEELIHPLRTVAHKLAGSRVKQKPVVKKEPVATPQPAVKTTEKKMPKKPKKEESKFRNRSGLKFAYIFSDIDNGFLKNIMNLNNQRLSSIGWTGSVDDLEQEWTTFHGIGGQLKLALAKNMGIHFAGGAEFAMTDGGVTGASDTSIEISASQTIIPLEGGLNFTFGKQFQFYVETSIGIYLCGLSWDEKSSWWNSSYSYQNDTESNTTLLGSAFGFRNGMGMELFFTPHFSIGGNANYRKAVISKMTGYSTAPVEEYGYNVYSDEKVFLSNWGSANIGLPLSVEDTGREDYAEVDISGLVVQASINLYF